MSVKNIFVLVTCALLGLLLNLPHTNALAIMSVDFGSEWMKVAVVAPGVPMEIALNSESQRKSPAAVAFRSGERTFGSSALTTGMRSPKATFFYVLDLLGKKIDNPVVLKFKERFPYYDIESDPSRGTVVFRIDEETSYSVEEITAQLLNHAKEIAMAHTNQKIKDVVITVPPFFNQAERRAMLAAANVCGLKVLSLMSTNAAVSLNYGMFRRKEINETAENILFYDMGASSTTATIASYQTIKTKDKGYSETNPQVTILGLGYDRTLGGLEVQLKLRDLLARKFNEMKKTPNDAFESPRAMGKFMKEAGKLLKVLSANQEYICQIEGVLDDKDFSLKVTRQEFEELCSDFFDRVRGPIDDALASAQIDISEINQFIIVGGATRIPKVQYILQSIWGAELGKNINADEAAALGAVYRAADLGQGFKVLKFHVKESTVFPIDVDFERLINNDDGTTSNKVVKRSLFSRGSTYPQKKVMTFNKHTADFTFDVNYGDLTHLSIEQNRVIGSRNISHITVEGVNDAFEKNLKENSEPKGIKAHFSMDDSGILYLTGMEAVFEKNITVEVKEEESTLSKIGSTLSNLFSGGEATDSANGTETNDTKANETLKEPEKKENKTSDASKEKQNKLVVVKDELQYNLTFLDHEIMTEDLVDTSVKKLKSIDAAEKTRKAQEQAKNNLESYILDVQDKLSHEEYIKSSTKDMRDQILAMAVRNEEWLYEDGFNERKEVYQDRVKDMELLFEPIRLRVREHAERPEAIKALNNIINASSSFLHAANEPPPEARLFTEVELKTLDDLIISTQKWLEEKETEQEQTDPSEDPKLKLFSIAEKIQELDREVKYLVNKAKLVQAKREKEAAEAKFKAEKEAKAKNKTKPTEGAENVNESALDENGTDSALKEGDSEAATEESTETDSRKEPPLPTMEEDERGTGEPSYKNSQENEEESDRRKEEADSSHESDQLAHQEM